MKVKLKKQIEGKFGTYPADTWLEATELEGFIYVHHSKDDPRMRFKLVAFTNVKEVQK
jgi:hypothetical protein